MVCSELLSRISNGNFGVVHVVYVSIFGLQSWCNGGSKVMCGTGLLGFKARSGGAIEVSDNAVFTVCWVYM